MPIKAIHEHIKRKMFGSLSKGTLDVFAIRSNNEQFTEDRFPMWICIIGVNTEQINKAIIASLIHI